jgi:hypothetical protein
MLACDVLPHPLACQRRARPLRSVPDALTKFGHSLRFFCAVKTSVESSLALINALQWMRWVISWLVVTGFHGWWSHAACNRLRGGRGTTDALKFVLCSGVHALHAPSAHVCTWRYSWACLDLDDYVHRINSILRHAPMHRALDHTASTHLSTK